MSKFKNENELKQKHFDFFVKFISNGNLNLHRQGLTDKDIPHLIRFLLQYPQVKTLDLSMNNIGDQGLADFAERNQTIVQADFTGNNISDNGLAVFAHKNQIVTRVNFSHNPISDQGITNFAKINQTCYNSQFSTKRLH